VGEVCRRLSAPSIIIRKSYKSWEEVIQTPRSVRIVTHYFADIDGIISAIEKIRQPSDIKNNEETIIWAG